MAGKRIISVQELEAMGPQERADAIDDSIVRSWEQVDPDLRSQIEARVADHAARRAAP